MSLGLVESIWPRPVADGIERARGWHLRQLTEWLTRAGAEPRLCLIICTGRDARDALFDACVAARVDIAPAPVSAKAPIAPALMAHRGDHFNATLFLMEGLAGAPDAVLETLDGMRGQLRRMATWVGLVVEDLTTLDRLERHAGGLMRAIQRTALVLGDGPQLGTVSPASLEAWRRRGRVAELAFASLSGDAPAYDDLSRLIRAGYGSVLATLDPVRRQAHQLWTTGALDGAPLTPALAEAALRHGTGASPEAAGPTARIAAGLDPMPSAGEGTDRLQIAVHRAQAMAEAGDLDGCMQALASAEPPPDGPLPELALDVLEKRITLQAFVGDRAAARAALERLDRHVERLASPGALARAIVARARFVAPLDPARARVDLLEAERLLRAHGYPERAAELTEELT